MGFNELGIIFKIRRTPEMINGSDVSGGAWTRGERDSHFFFSSLYVAMLDDTCWLPTHLGSDRRGLRHHERCTPD